VTQGQNNAARSNEISPLCATCGGPLVDWHCEPCRTTNGLVQGVLGEDLLGAEWTGDVDLTQTGDTRLEPRMRCAVSFDLDHGPHAWTQVPEGHSRAGQWATQGESCTSSSIYRACLVDMLARARRAEWLIEEWTRRRFAALPLPSVERVEEKSSGLYYLLSVKWTKRKDGALTWWGPDGRGYVFRLNEAGRYTAREIAANLDHYHNGQSTLAIPCEVVDAHGVPVATVASTMIERAKPETDLVVEICHFDRLRRDHVVWKGASTAAATKEQAR